MIIYSYSISAFYEYKKMGHQGKTVNAKNEIIVFGPFSLIMSLYAFLNRRFNMSAETPTQVR